MPHCILLVDVADTLAHQRPHTLNIPLEALTAREGVLLEIFPHPSHRRLVEEHIGAVCRLMCRMITREGPEPSCLERTAVGRNNLPVAEASEIEAGAPVAHNYSWQACLPAEHAVQDAGELPDEFSHAVTSLLPGVRHER